LKKYKIKRRRIGGKRSSLENKNWKGSGVPESDVHSFVVSIRNDEVREIEIRRNREGEWVEAGAYGHRYMSYLKPSDILVWLRMRYPGSRIDVIAVNDKDLE
jgi:hypothetical protein